MPRTNKGFMRVSSRRHNMSPCERGIVAGRSGSVHRRRARRRDLARHDPPGYTGRVNGRKRASLLQQAELVECRRCGVVCEKVVYPSACLAQGCPFLYAYQAFDRTYVGCTQNVFAVDIDLELLERASRRRNGFGAIKAVRPPLEICPAGVEKAYEHRD